MKRAAASSSFSSSCKGLEEVGYTRTERDRRDVTVGVNINVLFDVGGVGRGGIYKDREKGGM